MIKLILFKQTGTDGYICVILLTKTRDLSQTKDLLNLEQYEQGVEPSTETTEFANDNGVDEENKDNDLQKEDEEEATSAKKIKVDEP